MRSHDHESVESSFRPKPARLADRAAQPVVRAAAAGRADVLDPSSVLDLQRSIGNAGVGSMLEEERSPVHDVVNSGGGSPLAPDLREEMQGRLGHDFGDVRVHTDSQAHESARAVNAHAYTVGSNVVFQRDRFDPSSTDGKTMLAHELTHVVQQRQGGVDGTVAAGGIKVSDPADRFEREASANADRVMSSPPPIPSAVIPATAAVQRQDAPEEEDEEVQTSVQRQEEEVEEEPA